MLTKRCCSVNTHFPSRMRGCESIMHNVASYVGTPNISDFAFTRDIDDVHDARVHSDIQTTDHNPISIKVNGLRVVSWNIEGLCVHSKREAAVKTKLKKLQRLFPNEPILFLFQEVFLQREVNPNILTRMSRLLTGYTFLSDGYTGCIAIPFGIAYGNIQYIDRPDKKGKKCIVVTVTYKGIRTTIANIHLKSIVLYPMMGQALQRKEMQNILSKTQGPTLFMGDFNTETPEKIIGLNHTRKRRT